jgi:hypothetical protein
MSSTSAIAAGFCLAMETENIWITVDKQDGPTITKAHVVPTAFTCQEVADGIQVNEPEWRLGDDPDTYGKLLGNAPFMKCRSALFGHGKSSESPHFVRGTCMMCLGMPVMYQCSAVFTGRVLCWFTAM